MSNRYYIESKLGKNFLRDTMTPGIVIRPDEVVARLNSQIDEIAELTSEKYALASRVKILEDALLPFAHPDFTFPIRPANYPMWGYNYAELIYGDFSRAKNALLESPKQETTGPIYRTDQPLPDGV